MAISRQWVRLGTGSALYVFERIMGYPSLTLPPLKVCYTCNRPFGKDGFYNVRDFPYCPDHYQAAKAKAQSGH